MENIVSRKRIPSLDLLRGLVMMLMALDHTRDYFHYDAFIFDPTDLKQTTVPIFFTRFITHYCAPVFCFLAGTSSFLAGQNQNRNSLSSWLLKRGFWLIFAEITIIKLAWYFKLDYSFIDLAVIWSLGVSMVFLSGIIRLSQSIAIAVAFAFVFCHNLLDGIAPVPDTLLGKIWILFHVQEELKLGTISVHVIYPVLPWIGLMTLGYYFGQLYTPSFDGNKRQKILIRTGITLILLFLFFRIPNLYGDLHPWTLQDSLSKNILAVLNVTKYPPSFAYICITMGPALLLLALFEKASGAFAQVFITVGQVPMFFYILHIYAIHLIALFAATATGYHFTDMILDTWVGFSPNLKGYGFTLFGAYLVWGFILILLYPLCKKYNDYKKNNKAKWWLSYL